MLVCDVPGVRNEQIQLSDRGTVSSALVSSGDEQMNLNFDSEGRLINLTDPAGGAFQCSYKNDLLTRLTVPTGTYRFKRNKRRGRESTEVVTPMGCEVRYTYGTDDLIDRVYVNSPAGNKEIVRIDERTWSAQESGKDAIRVTTDEQNRVIQTVVENRGTLVTVQRGKGGMSIQCPDGRQLVVCMDQNSKVTELREYPAGLRRVSLPVPDLAAKRSVSEPFESLSKIDDIKDK